jgi:hypothetical protein
MGVKKLKKADNEEIIYLHPTEEKKQDKQAIQKIHLFDSDKEVTISDIFEKKENARYNQSMHCFRGVLITPEGIYNTAKVKPSEKYPKGIFLEPLTNKNLGVLQYARYFGFGSCMKGDYTEPEDVPFLKVYAEESDELSWVDKMLKDIKLKDKGDAGACSILDGVFRIAYERRTEHKSIKDKLVSQYRELTTSALNYMEKNRIGGVGYFSKKDILTQ